MPIKKEHKELITVIGGLGAIVVGLVAVLKYWNTREHRQLQKAQLEIDNEIKTLELEKRKSELLKSKLI
jgi:hypothetical protein